MVPKSVDIVGQAVVRGASTTSAIKSIGKAKSAMDGIQNDVPVVIEKSKTMTVAIQGAV
jgi:hypothetical protein